MKSQSLEKLGKNLSQIDTKDVEIASEAMHLEENEKEGIRATKEFNKEKDQIDDIGKNIIEDSLKKKRNFTKLEYKKHLAEIFMSCLYELDWPFGFDWRVLVTEKGIAVAFTDSHKLVYSKGFTETGEIKTDLNAIDTFVLQTENTIDRILNDEKRITRGTNNPGGTSFEGTGSEKIPQKPV